jgi:hypothetical protein
LTPGRTVYDDLNRISEKGSIVLKTTLSDYWHLTTCQKGKRSLSNEYPETPSQPGTEMSDLVCTDRMRLERSAKQFERGMFDRRGSEANEQYALGKALRSQRN